MALERRPAPVPGVRLAAAAAGIRAAKREDMALLELSEGAETAAVFTRNDLAAAPVVLARRHLLAASPRYLLINSGVANAATGDAGLAAALEACAAAAAAADVEPQRVLPFSTGVIGEALPLDRMKAALPALFENLSEDNWPSVARAIMTTDTRPKSASERLTLNGGDCALSGVAKGSGMIHPDMATMLAFVATDARVSAEDCADMLRRAMETSFHRISVDGATSTNDACVFVATGRGATPDDDERRRIGEALGEVCRSLARQIVEDGEGVTRPFEIVVAGGGDARRCLRVANFIACSPLVKTAVHAGDPNWGRVWAAAGAAGLGLNADNLSLAIGDVAVLERGQLREDYDEAAARRAMSGERVTLRLDLGEGDAVESVYAADLSAEYVKINAEYRS